MLRPRPARWFEVLTARHDATLVLEALARTGAVELQARADVGLPAPLSELAPLLSQYQELWSRHHVYWPASELCRPSAFPESPGPALQRCLATIRAWAQDAEAVIRALQRCQGERDELLLWQRVLGAWPAQGPGLSQLSGAGPWLALKLCVLPAHADPAAALQIASRSALCQLLLVDGVPHLLVAGESPALQAVVQELTALKGHIHELPDWLRGDDAQARATALERLARVEHEITEQRGALEGLHQRHGLHRALGEANRLQWLVHNVHALEADELLCWITGWSSDEQGQLLADALQRSGARALLRLTAPPAQLEPPLLLSNPPWARPFEIFSRALGMPASGEADPSQLLAVVVPLMFGYMFGDLGQGLLLAAAGAWYRKRHAIARLLMIGGLAAAVFGLLFGSVFGMHGLLPALWLHPLDAPLHVLLVPLVGGTLLLTLGMGLDGLAAAWRHDLRGWLLCDAALMLGYLALLCALIWPAALWLAAFAAAAFCAGHALREARVTAALSALGELVERTLQLLINTLSFARVGAFALAHAGLSSAIVALMDAVDSSALKVLVLVLGNLVVMVLEVLVVSIQTTRLVLFEFFTRFMHAGGRAFRPLPPPPFSFEEK